MSRTTSFAAFINIKWMICSLLDYWHWQQSKWLKICSLCLISFFFLHIFGANINSSNQVLTYAQQSKEQASIEQDKLAKRIQEFRTQAELNHMRGSSNLGTSTSSIASNGVGMNSDKNIEAIMQSSAEGAVSNITMSFLSVICPCRGWELYNKYSTRFKYRNPWNVSWFCR